MPWSTCLTTTIASLVALCFTVSPVEARAHVDLQADQDVSHSSNLEAALPVSRSLRSLPAETRTSLLLGHHVYTFDGKLYRLPDVASQDCAYLLARDHVEHRFTLLYTERSITVITPQLTLTLDKQLRLELNNSGQYSDFPAQSWDGAVTVTRIGSRMQVETRDGLKVTCDGMPVVCVAQVSAAYHNKLTGLLGNNDGNASNEFVMRNQVHANNIRQFVNSYEISGLSECRLTYETSEPNECPSAAASTCEQWFGRNRFGPYSDCFDEVDPYPFLTACLNEVRRCDSASNLMQEMCSFAGAYTRLCSSRTGRLMDLSHRCALSCGLHPIGSTWLAQASRQVDIALVASEDAIPENSSLEIGTILHKLSHNIRQSLFQLAGIQDYRVTVVGFGGRNALDEPHAHTSGGQIFTGALNEDTLNDKFSSFAGDSEAPTTIDAALRFATELPFRQGAVKIIFSIASPAQLAAYQGSSLHASLAEQVRQHSFILDVMSSYPVLQARKVLGMTSQSTLILEGPKRLTVRGQFPNDSLTRLARTSDGLLFDLQAVQDNHRHIFHAVGQHVARQVEDELGVCRQCQCVTNSYSHPLSQCRVSAC